jgi:hypothetical protein
VTIEQGSCSNEPDFIFGFIYFDRIHNNYFWLTNVTKNAFSGH